MHAYDLPNKKKKTPHPITRQFGRSSPSQIPQAMLLDELRFMVSDWAPTEPLTSQDEVDTDANIHDAWTMRMGPMVMW